MSFVEGEPCPLFSPLFLLIDLIDWIWEKLHHWKAKEKEEAENFLTDKGFTFGELK